LPILIKILGIIQPQISTDEQDRFKYMKIKEKISAIISVDLWLSSYGFLMNQQWADVRAGQMVAVLCIP